jgi:glyoxylase-like metal-dependent hydrolase (beta-lactamase superfamily II)
MTSVPKSQGPKAAHAQRRAPSTTPPAKSARRSSKASAPSAGEISARTAGPVHGDRASVRVYRQGLGDCILIRVKRTSGDDFKLLIDCGVVLGTPNAGDIMTRVVENLVKDTEQRVDAIAITHEHWDHVSGFNQAKDSFKKLKTDEVWVAWTEDKDDELANILRSELGKRHKRSPPARPRSAPLATAKPYRCWPTLRWRRSAPPRAPAQARPWTT